MSAVTRRLSEQVYEHASQGRCVLTLGGDHSLAIGSIAGSAHAIRQRLQGQELAVIWVDAHADLNTPETSSSGNIHGMPAAFLTGIATEDREDVFGWLQPHHMINHKKLVYIGLRDVDRGEKKHLKEYGIRAFSMHDIDRYWSTCRTVPGSMADLCVSQAWHRSSDGDGLGPHRHGHADPPVV